MNAIPAPPGEHHDLVIVGAGFAGLAAIGGLRGVPRLRIRLVDRRNDHIFQPLLYQAATSILPPSAIAWPVRGLMRHRPDVTTLMGAVTGVDAGSRVVSLAGGGALTYDTLILATGATHAYFGHDDWKPYAPGLKTLEDAIEIRRRILLAFERAEAGEGDPEALMSFVIVGAGPTGVELAGTIAELARTHLPSDFRAIDTRRARVILVEAGDRILPAFQSRLSDYARDALAQLGVEVRTGESVTHCDGTGVITTHGPIAAATVIWAAGVQASGAARWLGLAGDRAGRAPTEPNLSAPGLPNVFVIGDTAAVPWRGGAQVPGLAPAAKQQGAYVASVIRSRLLGRPPPPPFRYRHQGSLATIGRNRAIIDFGAVKLTGAVAWWLWGAAHIYFLISARTRAAVAWDWLWAYARNEPAARIITRREEPFP